MIYDSPEGAYLFGYDSLADTSSNWDNWFSSPEEAEEYCSDTFNIKADDWMIISEPEKDCQHDFILPTKVVFDENGAPQWGNFQTFINNEWIGREKFQELLKKEKSLSKQLLLESGLITEFETAKLNNQHKATKIISSLQIQSKGLKS